MEVKVSNIQHYLSHKLLFDVKGHDGKTYRGVELTSISTRSSYEHLDFINVGGRDMMPSEICMIHIEDCKPHFRDLSDLTTEITHNGDTFVPIDLMFIGNKKTNGRAVPRFLEEKTRELSEGKISHVHLQYWVIEQLIKWHFNVFNIDEEFYIKK